MPRPTVTPDRSLFTAPATTTDPPVGEPANAFHLRCADVHPVGCDVSLRASSLEDVVRRTRAHGASAHGFTPAWYSATQMAIIAAAVIG